MARSAKYIFFESLEAKFLNLSQSERLIDLFISRNLICYHNSETMEITLNKIFCLNLHVNPLRDTWYSRTYKDGGQQPMLC